MNEGTLNTDLNGSSDEEDDISRDKTFGFEGGH
jgi:hypothetical protein